MPGTIRTKIIAGFIGCFIFIGLLSVTFGWNIVVLKNKMTIIENFHGLLDDILELRRYEKNTILYGYQENSIHELKTYLMKTEKTIAELSDQIVTVTGDQPFMLFKIQFSRYKSLINASVTHFKSDDATEIRELGTAMLKFCDDLLNQKRRRINNALERMVLFSFTEVIGFIILIAVLFLMEAKSVFRRLSLITLGTKKLSQGHFKPITDNGRKTDEISQMILQFNRMVEELDSRQEQLVQSRKLASIGTFTSGIAHEINNPLNNISLTADGLLEEYQDLNEVEIKEMILDIINQAARASEVVKNLLDFSRKDRPDLTELSINEVISGTVELIKKQILLKKINVEKNIPADLPCIQGNLYNLEQVFINLFSNAMAAMPEGGRIHIDAADQGNGYVMIRFKDNGQGIPEENINRIFDPFYTTKGVGKGTGLGLSIVYGIIKKHGGYVEVKSQAGEGACFSIYLPVPSNS